MTEMQYSHSLLEDLTGKQKIRVKPDSVLFQPAVPKLEDFDWGKVEGMLLGLAIGDALGITTEGKLPTVRKGRFGEVRNYLPNKYTGSCLGYPSDDTQLAFWTLEQMIEDGRFDPEKLAIKFSSRRIFGIGNTVKRFIANFKTGVPWYEAGPESSGNGAVMRIAPMLIPSLRAPAPAFLAETALSAMLTHNDTFSISSCLSIVTMLWELLDMKQRPEPMWWVEKYRKETARFELDTAYCPRGGRFADYKGKGSTYVDSCTRWAWDNNMPVVDACDAWYSGAYLLETMPSVIYILMRHGNDPEEAIVRAVNDTKDNDSVAAIVGAAVGALHGRQALPAEWIAGLTGRTGLDDDGKVFRLLAEAKEVFWDNPRKDD